NWGRAQTRLAGAPERASLMPLWNVPRFIGGGGWLRRADPDADNTIPAASANERGRTLPSLVRTPPAGVCGVAERLREECSPCCWRQKGLPAPSLYGRCPWSPRNHRASSGP